MWIFMKITKATSYSHTYVKTSWPIQLQIVVSYMMINNIIFILTQPSIKLFDQNMKMNKLI
jgi:hypothetical protein